MLEIFHPFIVSFMIGLLIGIERERSHPKGVNALGVRTFVLMALLGSLAAWIHELAFTVTLSIFALGAIIAGYFRSTEQRHADFGLTTELSASIVYCLGYVALRAPLLATIIGGAVLLVLLSRKRLHAFSRNQLRTKEIQAAITILIIALGVLPFIPNYTIDPWQLFNPQRFCLLVLIIAGIQFGGYIAIRIFGQKLGMLLTGFLGGLVSSTAVFLTLPRMVHEKPTLLFPAMSAAVLATSGTLTELLIIIFVVSPKLTLTVLWPLLAIIVMGIVIGFGLIQADGDEPVTAPLPNPLDLKSVLRISIFIATMLTMVALANRYIGIHGVQLISLLGGLFELHSTSLAAAILYSQNDITIQTAEAALLLAVCGSFSSKFILLWGLARNRFAALTSLCLLGMLLVGVGVFWLV